MSTENFSRQEFEVALSAKFPFAEDFENPKFEFKQFVYFVPVNSNVRIKIGSSVGKDGFAHDTGDDSIRLWIEFYRPHSITGKMGWYATGKKVDAWTQRTAGWDKRMVEKIEILFNRAKQAVRPVQNCSKCGQPMFAGFSKFEDTKDRPYSRCKPCNNTVWLDTPIKAGEQLEIGEGPKTEDIADFFERVCVAEEAQILETLRMARSEPMPETDDLPWDDRAHGTEPKVDTTALKQRRKEAKESKAQASAPKAKPADSELRANPQQKEAIEAAIGESLRVLAQPGSGKTWVILKRYGYMVKNGVEPDSILVVTFSKPMADEMGLRIKKEVPVAETKQISTIHAFCFRVLVKWWDSSPWKGAEVPKDWQVKQKLNELIRRIWVDGRYSDPKAEVPADTLPSWGEVYAVINAAKNAGIPVAQSREFFEKSQKPHFARWLGMIRQQFDRWLETTNQLTFADMLFQMEYHLKTNENLRYMLQELFEHVIVDEAQDTNGQGLGILVTVAAKPGSNPVYDCARVN